jgi:hypothetical protein
VTKFLAQLCAERRHIKGFKTSVLKPFLWVPIGQCLHGLGHKNQRHPKVALGMKASVLFKL